MDPSYAGREGRGIITGAYRYGLDIIHASAANQWPWPTFWDQ